MSSIPHDYEMEAGSSEILAACDESEMLIEAVDNIEEENSNQGEKYYVITEVHEEPVNLVDAAEGKQFEAANTTEQNQSWNELCRVCANSSDHLIPIFEGEGLEHDLSSKIHRYLPIQVSREDSLPSHLCYHCASTLLAWHELTESCIDAEQRLLKMKKDLQEKEQTVTLEDSLNEKSAAPPSADSNQITKTQMPAEGLRVKGESNEESKTNDSERSSSIQMPFKAFLDIQSIFWKPYKKSEQKINGNHVKEDDTEPIWITVTDSAFDQPTITSDPLCLSDNTLQRDCRGHYSQGVTKKLIRAQTDQAPSNDKDISKKEAESKDSPKVPPTKTLTDINKVPKPLSGTQESYQCHECGKCFKLKDSFQRHMRIHTDERPFTCHICAKQFRDSGGLSRHLKDVHAKVKKFSCDMCGKSFASKATREDHRRTHTGERPYLCKSCGNTFRSKASLYIHSKRHTNEFPHPCSYCHKKFRRKQEMLAHVTTHTGEKNHSCEICSKRFRVKSELVRHKLIHSEDKPFSCSRCGLAFRQKRYLNNHIKSRHFDTLRNC
ncbi:zinc finger protein ZFP2-like isoform X5 [Athalia rosae]|uniref:zinc finger protein ZFP2-like isoform X5 n=1 Tax=Athalia rosae TaxID=37344 RepID=UPI0020333BA4|nr:zinc finger protein ZFP2-like isoform X5 [Athalia rosae]